MLRAENECGQNGNENARIAFAGQVEVVVSKFGKSSKELLYGLVSLFGGLKFGVF